MKTAIVYESITGSTEQIARAIQSGARAAGGEILTGTGVTGRLAPDADIIESCTALGKTGID